MAPTVESPNGPPLLHLACTCLVSFQVLLQVAHKEHIELSSAAATSIASVADGDLRNAIQTLQMLYQQHGDALGQRKGGGAGGPGQKVR
jgi:hypothetical protein